MSDHSRPLLQPFSESATDTPVDNRAGMVAVERSPFLEPVAPAPTVPAARRQPGRDREANLDAGEQQD